MICRHSTAPFTYLILALLFGAAPPAASQPGQAVAGHGAGDESILELDALYDTLGTAYTEGEAIILPFEYVRHIFVEATVNGQRADLLYDPIRNVMLDRTYARHRGFRMMGGGDAGYGGPVTTGGAGADQHEVLFVRDVSVQLGELSFNYPLGPVIPLDSIMATSLGRHVDGLLGINVLSDYVVEFDFPRRQFILHPFPFEPSGDAVRLPITWMERRPTVPLQVLIDGEQTTATFLLDFGMSGAVRFTTRYTDEENLVDRLQPNISANNERGMGGALTSRVARLPRLHVGALSLDSLVVSLAREADGADAYREWDGLVGLDLLSRFTLHLDLKNDHLWLRPNQRFDRPSERIDTGLAFEPQGQGVEGLVARSVRSGSDAEKAGFAIGDVVRSVGGKQADTWHIRNWIEALETHVGGSVPVVVRRGVSDVHLDLDVRTSM